MKTFSFTTQLREIDATTAVQATVRYESLAGQAPYFSVTCTIYGSHKVLGEKMVTHAGKRWWPCGGGFSPESIAPVFPELVPFLRWHLCSAEAPMHYAANAVFWAQVANGVAEYTTDRDTPQAALASFKSTVIFGAVEGDDLPYCVAFPSAQVAVRNHRAAIRAQVEIWCARRLPALQEAFARDLAAVAALEGTI